jgi:tellurite resistance protein TehA-like permease
LPSKPEFAVRARMHSLRFWLTKQIETLDPGAFALVMATGIISNALLVEGQRELSDALLAVTLIAYCSLGVLTVLRAVLFWRVLRADLVNPGLVFSFFTIVAATGVFGSGIDLRGFASVAQALWVFALIAWLVMTYFSFGVLTFFNTAHGADVVRGGWLIAIVATESLVILGSAVAGTFGALEPGIFVLLHMLWGIGLALYGIYVALFAYRIFFFEVVPDDLTPILWVVMGAAAISTNAGADLILNESGVAFLTSMPPVVGGVTLIMWAWATWWIPLLVLFGIWKHLVRRVPLTYTPMLWGLVFPLGMYSLASFRLAMAADFPPLRAISHAMVWIALAAWLATSAGLAATSWKSFRDTVRGLS